MSLQEIADERGMKIVQTHLFNKQGQPRDITPNSELPPIDDIISKSFTETLEQSPELLGSEAGSYYLVSVNEVVPSKIPEFEAVRPQVIEALTAQNAQETSRKNALEVAELLIKKAKPLPANVRKRLESGVKHPSHEQQDVSLGDATRFPPMLIEASFKLKQQGDVSQPMKLADGNYAIVQLVKRHAAKMGDDANTLQAKASLRDELNESYTEELLDGYLGYLAKQYPIEVNQPMIDSLL